MLAGAVAGCALVGAAVAQERELVINYDDLNPAPRTSFEAVVDKFRAAYPEIKVETNIQDREAYKTAIRNFLTADAPDVAAWYAGNRMAPFVEAGLFADVSDVWTDNGFDKTLASTMPSMTIDGKQYGVPYTYYQWGIYYRSDVFEDIGLNVPTNFDELIAACQTLRENGKTPFTIGTKFLWPAAGVFDYLNLRTNGYDFHNELTAGKVKFSDPRVVAVFENWKKMLDAECFIDNHASMSWQDALAP
ncbi:MAG: extracellular solute-binding protein, partial [Bacteroidota bacterium]